MRISELATATGLPATTLRFYESEGLISPARHGNGYRDYTAEDVDRIEFIAQARTLELPLSEVRDLVTAWTSEPCQSVRAKYRPMLAERIADVDARAADLADLRSTLTSAVARLDQLPDKAERCDPTCSFLQPVEPGPAIACSLDGGDHAAQVERWHDLVAQAVEHQATPSGFTLALPVHLAGDAARLAADEQACCPFLRFTLTLDGATVELTATAPTEARALLSEHYPPLGGTR